MRATLVAEYRKIVTTRTWWVLLLVMVAYMAFLGATMAFTLTFDRGGDITTDMPQDLDPATIVATVYSLPASLGYTLPLLVGLLAVTAEFRHRTLTPTLLAQPSRSTFVTGKMLASVPMGLLYGVAGTLATLAGAVLTFAFTGAENLLGEGDTWSVIGRTTLALTIWCMFGVGLGFAIPNQVVAIVVVLAFTQFVEPLLRGLLNLSDATAGIGRFLPGAAGEALSGGSLYATLGVGEVLGAVAGGLVLVGYALLLALLGRFTTLRRDIT